MKKICLDAGHGGHDPGAVNGSRKEKDDTLRFTLALGKRLADSGVNVIYTRTTDKYDSPSTKADIANTANANLLISIHRNAAAQTAKGTEVLVYSNKDKKAELATNLCKKYQELGFVNRGVKVRTDLAVLKRSKMPTVLLELGFISNMDDNKIYDAKFTQIVATTAEEILRFFNIKLSQPKRLGWVEENGKWYYYDPRTGDLMRGFILVNGKTYYMTSDGSMLTEQRLFTPDQSGAL